MFGHCNTVHASNGLVLFNVEQEWRVELAIKRNARQAGIHMLECKKSKAGIPSETMRPVITVH